MTTIGFIGSGLIGATLARLSIAAGYDVVLSNSRDPKTLLPLVAALGTAHASAATPEEAARAGDLVVVTIPLKSYRDVPVEPLRGKVVIDTNNYYPQRDGQIPRLDDESTTSGQLLQEHLPESKVVKAFNNINFRHLGELARPTGDPHRAVLPIAGDDTAAKQTVTEYLDAIGYDTLDAGPLAEGWRYENGQPAYARLYVPAGASPQSLLDMGPGHPATRDEVAAALSEARRRSDT
ncbi:NADPH-dependent F420 reductase [Georgenia sp. TF02-10]|uniref:NADPH-dependent F420 reductase n=1 Tax=Georgenia sp. TF02-10 TaxID=2917725 RepID=UPI001FA7606A|nr:NADPH-dependent F420 reductase [Georgenia sp. TF02-10]UNX53407.1 NADPH-dependent F420 reductase [Georgenia sp. TF02-10]